MAFLAAEMQDKSDIIQQINRDRDQLEEVSTVAMTMGMQISEQQDEIQNLNEKYRSALREKVEFYDEFVENIKEIIKRNARFGLNEVQRMKVVEEARILKKELEQKEKRIEELYQEIDRITGEDIMVK